MLQYSDLPNSTLTNLMSRSHPRDVTDGFFKKFFLVVRIIYSIGSFYRDRNFPLLKSF